MPATRSTSLTCSNTSRPRARTTHSSPTSTATFSARRTIRPTSTSLGFRPPRESWPLPPGPVKSSWPQRSRARCVTASSPRWAPSLPFRLRRCYSPTTLTLRGRSKEFYDFAQKGRLDLFFLSGGQIDRHGNLNTIAIGSADRPRLRLPGGAGSAMLYYLPRRVIVFRADHSQRIFRERVDVVNAPGSTPPSVVRPGGPWKVITPLCVFRFDPAAKALRVESLHPGVSPEELRSKTDFPVEAS